jgi:hypothetical protein
MIVWNFREVYKSVLDSFLPKVVVCANYRFSADAVYHAIFHALLVTPKITKNSG